MHAVAICIVYPVIDITLFSELFFKVPALKVPAPLIRSTGLTLMRSIILDACLLPQRLHARQQPDLS